jgi:hypothetical protein
MKLDDSLLIVAREMGVGQKIFSRLHGRRIASSAVELPPCGRGNTGLIELVDSQLRIGPLVLCGQLAGWPGDCLGRRKSEHPGNENGGYFHAQNLCVSLEAVSITLR